VSRVVLTPVGSAGDVNPFIWLGRALKARGHEVVLITAAPFRASAEREGLTFLAVGDDQEFARATQDPDLWHPRKGLRLVLDNVALMMRRGYDALASVYEPGRTVLVGHALAFSTRVFEEKQHAPAVTVHLSPSIFRSTSDPSAIPLGPNLARWPAWLQHGFWRGIDRFAIDPLIAPVLNQWRAELGLSPVARVFDRWIHSPQGVIGLFPDWFASPQADWPEQTQLAGFVVDEGAGGRALDADIGEFLDAGSPPLVFTPGSANRYALAFFRAAADAAGHLGTRALLVTPYVEHVPADLPDAVRHVTYAPFNRLFPRAAAVVHHGGIGTTAQGFAAGVPQLLMPMGFDQPDNAVRTERLGVGAWLKPARFTADRVARAIERLLTDASLLNRCREIRERVQAEHSLDRACQAIEAIRV
jgi:rhamnosyltransferase subunit B